jgi:hypothetical protein
MRNWPAYRKAWMRRWRANPENKGHERALDKLRRWVRLGLAWSAAKLLKLNFGGNHDD